MFTINTQPLRLVLIPVGTKPQKLGHLRIHPSQGMRQSQRGNLAQSGPFTQSDETSPPVALFVERYHQPPLKRRSVKRASPVAQMMIERFFLMIRRPPKSPLYPYTIHFRSHLRRSVGGETSHA